jgi:hypothetical protein
MKHTQGEWFVNNHNNEMKVRARNTMMGTICTINDIFESEAEANAKLIAAAPKLLESCIELLSFIERQFPNEDGEAIYDARQAIEEATK